MPQHNKLAITDKIRRHFMEHPGTPVWIADLRELGAGFTDKQIQAVVYNSRGPQGPLAIEIVSPGHCWVYRGLWSVVRQQHAETESKAHGREVEPPEPVRTIAMTRLFQERMVTKSGAIVIEDDQGSLFVATPLDL